jgi:hypothetical protein
MSRWISILVVLVCLATPTVTFLKYLYTTHHVSPGQEVIKLTDYGKEAIQFRRERNNSVAQLTILLIGGLWALIIGKDRPVRLNARIWSPFLAANACLALSYAIYLVSIDRIAESLYEADNLDLFSPVISVHSNYQMLLFSLGIIFAAFFALLFYRYRRVEV